LTKEYAQNNSGFTPTCSQFTPKTATLSSPDFSFHDLNISDINYPDFPDWAILKPVLLTGLEDTRSDNGNQQLTIASGYRSPSVEHIKSPKYPKDRHVHGDAADIASNQATWQPLHDAGKQAKACVEPIAEQIKEDPQNPYGHVHVDWRAVDHESWDGNCPGSW